MLDSTGATGGPVRLNERTGRAIFMRAIWFAAVATGGAVAFAIGYGAGSFGVFYWLFLWLVGWSVQFGVVKEWAVDGQRLLCRLWRSRPGSEPTAVLQLGPGVEVVHETWGRWRVWPKTGGATGRAAIDCSTRPASSPTTAEPSRYSSRSRLRRSGPGTPPASLPSLRPSGSCLQVSPSTFCHGR